MSMEKIAAILNAECCICLETLENGNIKITECRHLFHELCINKWCIDK